MLYPKGRLHSALESQPELKANMFEALRHIRPEQLVSEGGVYGGGLHKVEPTELAQISARSILEGMAAHLRVERQVSLL